MEQNEQKQFRCTGDCTQCPRIQREYCAAQKGYDNQRLLLALTGKIEELQAKITAIQDSEASVFIPSLEEKDEGKEYDDSTVLSTSITQKGDGAEE